MFRPQDRTELRDRLIWTEEEPETRDRFKAMQRAAVGEKYNLGIFYKEDRPTYQDEWDALVAAVKNRRLPVHPLDPIVTKLQGSER